MEKREFYFPSKDGITRIHGIAWEPEGEVRAILQICHGMVEHIDRYDEFARYLTARGYYVVGHDHLGHGKSVRSKEYLGYFDEKKGNEHVITDIHRLRRMVQGKYPGTPYFMLGHSMGSFLLRQYLTLRGYGLAGAIIMATGYMPYRLLVSGQTACRAIAARKGWLHRSDFVNQLGVGGYNKAFQNPDSKGDWTTSDLEMMEKTAADPLCHFTFTIAGYYQMMEGMKALVKKDAVMKIPKDLPILFAAGGDDPVGDCGAGVWKVYKKYLKSGIKDVGIKIYPGDRHEILNETDRMTVYEDLYQWLEARRQVDSQV